MAATLVFFEEEERIFTGRGLTGTDYLSSADFYFAAVDSWRAIGSLNTEHRYCPMSMLGGQIMFGGG